MPKNKSRMTIVTIALNGARNNQRIGHSETVNTSSIKIEFHFKSRLKLNRG
jgi:hypothetical protein